MSGRFGAALAAVAMAGLAGPTTAQRAPSGPRTGMPGMPRQVDLGGLGPRIGADGTPLPGPLASRDPAALAAEWFPHNDGETPLQAWLRKNMEVQQPSQPEAVANALTVRASQLAAGCTPAISLRCGERDALLGAAAGLRAGLASAPDCGAAARAFAPHYADADPPEAVARRFDVACLGSVEGRRTDDGAVAPAPMPAVIAAGRADPAHGALAAVGILERSGIPFCGGLIRPDATVVTAKHCYDRNRTGFDDGAVTVRPASGHAGPWRIAGVKVSPQADTDAAADDWIVLSVTPGADFSAPQSTLAAMPLAGEVTVLGHYAHFGAVGYADPGAPIWRKGLRYPREGLCQAVRLVGGCLQIACQTVRGFSGSPVLLPAAGADGRPQVVGFVSQDYTAQARCAPALAGATLAVSAAVLK